MGLKHYFHMGLTEFGIKKWGTLRELNISCKMCIFTVESRLLYTLWFLDLRFGLYSPIHYGYENKRYTIEKPYKIAKRNAKKILNFPKFVRFLGHFLKKQCFWKMGMAGIKQLPCPSKIASFSWKLNEEALLKVSFKNADWFQKYKTLKWKIIF